MLHRILRTVFVLLLTLLPISIGLLWYFLVGFHAPLEGNPYNRGQNAIWLDHQWVDTVHPEETLKTLGETLLSHDIRYIYVHTGPFESDGTLSKNRYFRARMLLKTLHGHFPSLKWYAWLGQLRSKVDLNNEQVRTNMVEAAQTLIQTIGFDGIHYNIEPSGAEDTGFMALLKQTREALPDTPISLATDEWQPKWLSEWVSDYFEVPIVSYWSTEDFKAVVPYIDQIVVMGYDTSLSSEEWYRWFLEQQVIHLTKIAAKGARQADEGIEVLIGIPAYEKGQEGAFDPAVENIENGLLGILQGLTNWRSRPEAFTGVAIYPYWEMEEEEWEVYEELWGRNDERTKNQETKIQISSKSKISNSK